MDTHICILAAGQSKRMKSKVSKLLHPLCGKPMIEHVRDVAAELEPATCAVVAGFQRDQVMDALHRKPVDFVVQQEQLGTGHAVSEFLKQYPAIEGVLLVMNGDTPLVHADLLRRLLALHMEKKASVSLLTTDLPDATGYGRIVRGKGGMIERIVEEADATEHERAIHEINSGIYAFDIARLRALLPLVNANNKQKEYYLPDVIEFSLMEKRIVVPFKANSEEVLGINTRVELANAEKILRRRINEYWMLRGVTMRDPESTYVDADVQIAPDTVLYPNVYLEGSTSIGADVTIHQNCRITDSFIDDRCVIYESSSIELAHLEQNVKIGPFARIRPDSYLHTGVRIGNFVELKKTNIGRDSKANHLSYLGDATIGRDVNVGAGTITCNYDGEKKHPTVIEDGVFIGSDTQLIAPVKVGKGAYVAAGSSITEDVPADSLAIARGRQINKEGWVAKKRKTTKTQRHEESK